MQLVHVDDPAADQAPATHETHVVLLGAPETADDVPPRQLRQTRLDVAPELDE